MDILTKEGKLLIKKTISTISLCVASSAITAMYIRTEYMDENILKDTFSTLGVDRSTLDNRFNRVEPVKHKNNSINDNNTIDNNISTIISATRPIDKIDSSVVNRTVYTVTNDLRRAIYGYESEHNTTVFSKSKDHSGICQMGDDALSDVGYKGDHFKFARENFKVQDLYCTKRFISIISLLRRKKIRSTIYTIYTVHQQGYKNGLILLNNRVPSRTNLISNINNKYLIKAWTDQTKTELLKWYNKKKN